MSMKWKRFVLTSLISILKASGPALFNALIKSCMMSNSFCFASDNFSWRTSDPKSPGSRALSCWYTFDGWEDSAASSSAIWCVTILVTVYHLPNSSLSTFSVCLLFSFLSPFCSLVSIIDWICALLIWESWWSSSSLVCCAALLISRNSSKEVPPRATSSFLESFTVWCPLPDFSFNPGFLECGEVWCAACC